VTDSALPPEVLALLERTRGELETWAAQHTAREDCVRWAGVCRPLLDDMARAVSRRDLARQLHDLLHRTIDSGPQEAIGEGFLPSLDGLRRWIERVADD